MEARTMTTSTSRHNDVIVDFQSKRGESSAAFFLPFLSPGMRLLDAGCGPGTITAAFCGAVGQVVGIDIEPKAITAARQLTGDGASANLRFEVADMMSLPFGPQEFDAVFFHAVLYHQPPEAIERTLAEARRVLKPDGLIATRDADVGGNILYPDTAGLHLALDLWQRWYEHSNAEALQFGRRQGVVLRANGFDPIWSGASYVNHSADAAARRDTTRDAIASLRGLSSGLVAKALAEAAEVETAIDAWRQWGEVPDSVYLRCRCECVARKRHG
jgi:SAM-dependent methyltransferase